MLRKLLLSLFSAILMSLGWVFESGVVASIAVVGSLVSFVPLLIIQKESNGVKFIRYVILTFLLFNLITISWVAKSAFIGVVSATLVYIVLFISVIYLYNYVWRRALKPLSYTVFVTAWIAAERLYLNGEISFPWLNIGNSFAQNPYIIQWIEYTGVSGLTLWALVSNLLVFEMIEAKGKLKLKFRTALILTLIIPISISFLIYSNYKQPLPTINVTVLQPNIDPYNEKFGGLTTEEQEDILVDLIESSPKCTKYFVAPETALDRSFYIDNLNTNPSINRIRRILTTKFPKSTYIGGLSSYKIYSKPEFNAPPTVTARETEDSFYDIYNSSIQIDTSSNLPLYHKVKLVIGVEMLPYHEHIPFINSLSVSLGGISGMLGSSDNAVVFDNNTYKNIKVGSAICYESLYGEYFSEFVASGAQAMFIITNDGWWDDTFGYHQHLMFSRLRAIETRRSISRSANTGISAFVNQKGEITKQLGWDVRGVINSDVSLNNEITFFVKYGDMIGRVSSYTLILCLLYYVAYRRKKKDHLV